MESRRTFGRRTAAQPPVVGAMAQSPVDPVEPLLSSLSPDATLASVDDEIAAWKAARGSVIRFPWRQISLMAGLCFGIASFVLPDTVNDAVQWPLYVLTAISLYVGLRKRKNKSN
jgi:hypothetical protein